jgi:ribosomal-protein-serine acetyltransferase
MLSIDVDPHIRLRLLEGHEALQLFTLTDDNRSYLRRWLPWLDDNANSENTLRFIEGTRERHGNREAAELGIFYRDNLVGMAGLDPLDWGPRRAEIGYWLSEDAQGLGIMHHTCRALIDYAFDEFDLNRLEIRCAVHNQRSRAVAERLGFQCEGVLRQVEWLYDHFVDHALYALLRAERQKTR